jgi:hypothetical protein
LIDIASYYANHDYNGLTDGFRDWLMKLINYTNRRVCGGFLRRLTRLVGDVEVKHVCPICGSDSDDGGTVGFVDVDGLAEKFRKGTLVVIFWDLLERCYKLVYSYDWLGLFKWFYPGDCG